MTFVKKLFKKTIKYFLLTLKNPENILENIALFFVSIKERHKLGKFKIYNSEIIFPDSASFMFMYDEIFKKRIYDFKTKSEKPYVVDGGANIGLATIFIKNKYPNSEIVCFEPDPKINEILISNMDAFNFNDVSIVKKGLWKEESELSFLSDGSDGGRISEVAGVGVIEVTSLKPYLQRKVDFLKLDIEGSEVDVIEDCTDVLFNVDNLFVEFHSFKNKKQQLDKILKILSDSGFRYYLQSVGVERDNLFLANDDSFDLDMQINIFASRLN